MCGISGIINKKGAVAKDLIKSMNDSIIHRGPDDEGFYFSNNIALAHRRLSILDLSKAGHQPMSFLDKYVITYNGEVYNYIEIKNELIDAGYVFKSKTDTEVILAAYDYWGEQCVKYFNGMWAFAIYDIAQKKIFCSRDRFGIKPFYYSKLEDRFIFGSEIKQLLPFQESKLVNQKILVEYLWYDLEEHSNETFFKNIYKLEQSHNLIYCLKQNTFEIKRYYDLQFDSKIDSLKEDDAVECIRQYLYHSIRLRLRSDVQVGTCLSGGLDSSSIAAIASKEFRESSKSQFMAIHAKSIEAKTDESKFAHMVANHCNLNLVQVEPSLADLTRVIDEVIYTQEEPFGGPSIFMQYFVMKSARENNCIVLLDGQGGDETLFGYEGYYSYYFSSLLSKFKLGSYFSKLKKIKTFRIKKKKIVRDSLLTIFRNQLSFIERAMKRRKTFIKIKHSRDSLNHIYSFLSFKDFQKREMTLRNLPRLLRYEDKNSMRNSIETRLPFVDYQFVEKAISISDSIKIKNGFLKYLLRKVVSKLLPSEIVWRTNKFGFEAPTDLWINQHRNEMIIEIEKSELIKDLVDINQDIYKNQKMLWKLFNLAVWERVYEVRL